jgi:hypothetical protein
MEDMGFPTHLTALLKSLYANQTSTVRTSSGDCDWFNVMQGVRQGCIASPHLFNIYAEGIMRKALDGFKGGISIGGRLLNNLRYADDTTLLTTTQEDMQELIERVRIASEECGLFLNVKKTKIMAIGDQHPVIKANNNIIDIVEEFNFLGSYIKNTGGSSKEIKRRLSMARTSMINMQNIWKNHDVSKSTKIRLINSLIFSIATYGCESWTLTQDDRSKINAFEMWVWRHMLQISWKDHKTNEYVRDKINNPPRLLNKILGRKLKYFGHIRRRDGENLEKNIMEGKIEGKGGRGRPRKRWIDDIKMELGIRMEDINNTALNRHHWRQTVQRVTRERPTL